MFMHQVSGSVLLFKHVKELKISASELVTNADGSSASEIRTTTIPLVYNDTDQSYYAKITVEGLTDFMSMLRGRGLKTELSE